MGETWLTDGGVAVFHDVVGPDPRRRWPRRSRLAARAAPKLVLAGFRHLGPGPCGG